MAKSFNIELEAITVTFGIVAILMLLLLLSVLLGATLLMLLVLFSILSVLLLLLLSNAEAEVQHNSGFMLLTHGQDCFSQAGRHSF